MKLTVGYVSDTYLPYETTERDLQERNPKPVREVEIETIQELLDLSTRLGHSLVIGGLQADILVHDQYMY